MRREVTNESLFNWLFGSSLGINGHHSNHRNIPVIKIFLIIGFLGLQSMNLLSTFQSRNYSRSRLLHRLNAQLEPTPLIHFDRSFTTNLTDDSITSALGNISKSQHEPFTVQIENPILFFYNEYHENVNAKGTTINPI